MILPLTNYLQIDGPAWSPPLFPRSKGKVSENNLNRWRQRQNKSSEVVKLQGNFFAIVLKFDLEPNRSLETFRGLPQLSGPIPALPQSKYINPWTS